MTKRVLLMVAAVATTAMLVVACSSEDMNRRGAAGEDVPVDAQEAMRAGVNSQPVDIDAVCSAVEARNTSHNYQNTTCDTLVDGVDAFSGPGRIAATKVPLTVTRFTAETSDSNRRLGSFDPGDTKGLLGGERGTQKSSGYKDSCPKDPESGQPTACLGALQPNPFDDRAVMAFEAAALSDGSTQNRLYVNSNVAPFSVAQVAAQPWVRNYWTYSGAPDSGCTNGEYLSCRIVTDVDRSVKGGYQRPVFEIGSWPLVVRVVNAMTSSATPRYRLRPLIDPDWTGILKSDIGTTTLPIVDGAVQGIAPNETYSFGGYRRIGGEVLWQGFFEVTDMAGGTTVTPTCQSCGSVVNITIRIDPNRKDEQTGKLDPYVGSSCFVTVTRGSLACDAPSASGSADGFLTVTVNVKDF